jgi:hypothetical protein
MKKQILFLFLGILLFSFSSALNFAGGNGSAINPYQIGNWTALNETRLNLSVSVNYLLVANLSSASADYSGIGNNWVPIGITFGAGRFGGTFDGGGNTISDLVVVRTTTYAGLFGTVTGNISNVGVLNVSVNGTTYVGGLVGLTTSKVTNCYSTGRVNGTTTYAGGLVGSVSASGNVSNSYSTATVYTSVPNDFQDVGGLVGYCLGKIYNSYATGNVSGCKRIGGLVGESTSTCIIYNSYATGYVRGFGVAGSTNTQIGGLVGYLTGNIQNSYATGFIHSDQMAGGLVGYLNTGSIVNNSYSTGFINNSFYFNNLTRSGGLVGGSVAAPTVVNSYWDMNTSGKNDSLFGIGKTTIEMKNITTFVLWNITNTTIDLNNGYPYLSWQKGTNTPIWLIANPFSYCYIQINPWTVWYPIGCSRWREIGSTL